MASAQSKIAATIERFYDDGEPMSAAGIKYKDTVARMEHQAQEEVTSRGPPTNDP